MSRSCGGAHVRLAVLASLALSGCNLLQLPSPYPAGLMWRGSENVTTVTTAYKAIEGTAVESIGSVGDASTCGGARESAGTSKNTTVLDRVHTNEVVGNTRTDHPLSPGSQTFGPVGVSVVAEQIASTGSFQLVETFNTPDASTRTWEERSAGAVSQTTAARYHGVAADEYVVSLFPLDLWTATDFGGTIDTGEEASEYTHENALTLLTRHKPVDGDLWTSLTGHIVYVYDGTERLNIGGKGVNANRVKVYTNGDFDATAGDAFADCLHVGPLEDTTTFPQQDSLLTRMVVLDPGCANRFKHQQIGTEWWYGDVLVQSEGVTSEVVISDFGWEWYEEDGPSCRRRTSTVEPTNADADLFLEYSVVVTTSTFVVDTWEIGAAKE
jgi:hypothetical protein